MEFVFGSVFYEVAALLALASAMGLVALALRQPLIVALLFAGVVAGPAVLGLAQSDEFIELLAKLGVSVLLFLVGLQLDLTLIRRVGPVALMTGLGQVAFTSVVGFGLCLALGLDVVTSVYVSVALTFSSTIIIVKLLSDKRELDSLHGRIALGFLIVQDLVVVLAMIVLSTLGIGRDGDVVAELATVLGSAVVLVLLVGLFIRYVADPLTKWLVRAPELMVTFAIAWAALTAAVADAAGLSMELGGLLAGVSLASTPYREIIGARLVSIRDFMLLFFFVGLGTQLDLSAVGDQILPAVLLSLFVLIGNPLIVVAIMGAMGYRARTGFLAGLTVAQISEFSLVFMAMGMQVGDVGVAALSLVTLVGLITIAMSTYMILYSHVLYSWLEPALRPFERRVPFREPTGPDGPVSGERDVILFGLGRYGGSIARQLMRMGLRIVAVDFDPDTVRRFREQGIETYCGAEDDAEFLGALPLRRTRWVVSAIHTPYHGPTGHDHRLVLLRTLKEQGFEGRIALTAHDERDAVRLRRAGADLVLMPFADAAKRAAETLGEDAAEAGAKARATAPPGEGRQA